jgi:hypothetical protein
MQSFLTHRSIAVPAGQRRHLDVSGEFFACTEAANVFNLTIDDVETVEAEVGFEYRLKLGDTFKRLAFHNPGSDDQTIQFYCGRGDIQDKRLNSRLTRQEYPIKNTLKTTGLFWSADLAPFTLLTVVFDPVLAYGADVIVTNLHATLDLKIRDLGSPVNLATVFPRTSWTAQIMESFAVMNENPFAIPTQVMATSYPN